MGRIHNVRGGGHIQNITKFKGKLLYYVYECNKNVNKTDGVLPFKNKNILSNFKAFLANKASHLNIACGALYNI